MEPKTLDEMSFDELRAEFEKTVAPLQITMTGKPVDSRPNGDEWAKDACHYALEIQIRGRKVWSGTHSAGRGAAYSTIKKNPEQMKKLRARITRLRVTSFDTFTWQQFEAFVNASRTWSGMTQANIDDMTAALRNAFEPSLVDVLSILVQDATQEDFEEWASNLGYDTDSRKAEHLWRECADIDRVLRRELGSETLERLQDIAYRF